MKKRVHLIRVPERISGLTMGLCFKQTWPAQSKTQMTNNRKKVTCKTCLEWIEERERLEQKKFDREYRSHR